MNNTELIKWVNSLPLWLRKVAEVYCKEESLLVYKDVGVRREYFGNLLMSGKYKKIWEECIDDFCNNREEDCHYIDESLVNEGAGNKFSLLEIKDIVGVGRLHCEPGHPFRFAEKGVTVIYGTNGNGKSSYTKILKAVSGIDTFESIENDVYSNEEGIDAQCVIVIKDENEAVQEIKCTDINRRNRYRNRNKALSTIRIFDTELLSNYYQYGCTHNTWQISLIACLDQACNNMRIVFKDDIRDKILQGFSREQIGSSQLLQDISSAWETTEINNYPQRWTEQDENKLQELKSELFAAGRQENEKETEEAIKRLEVLLGEYSNGYRGEADSNYSIYEDSSIDFSRLKHELQNILLNIESDKSIRARNSRKLLSVDELADLEKEVSRLEIEKKLAENYVLICDFDRIKKYHEGFKVQCDELLNTLFSQEYIDRFASEISYLSRGMIKARLDFNVSTLRGNNPYRIRLDWDKADIVGREKMDKINPAGVYSEGEYRIGAMAAFITELEMAGDNSPVIFDDPISSLDDYYSDAVTKRIVELSKERQVIVFTHRIPLVVGIYSAMEEQKRSKNEFKEIYLIPHAEKKGVPSKTPVLTEKGLKKHIMSIKKEVEGLDEFSDKALKMLPFYCSDLRIAIEECIEKYLLCDVVQRFRMSIQTGNNKLRKLAKINSQDCELFDELMTEYSYYHHSNPNEKPKCPSKDQFLRDCARLIEWIDEYEKRPIPD